jgi:hypothetical protein
VQIILEIPAASTHAGVTTRLKPNKARQCKLPGLVLFVHQSRDLRATAGRGMFNSRDASFRNPLLKRLETPQRLGIA